MMQVNVVDKESQNIVVGSNPILDGCKQFASYYIEEKLKIKVAKWGTPKKYFFQRVTKCLKGKFVECAAATQYKAISYRSFFFISIKIKQKDKRENNGTGKRMLLLLLLL
jgi:hypothetical protein